MPMSAVVDTHTQKKPIVIMGNQLNTSVVNSTLHNENMWKTSSAKLTIVSVD